MKKLKLLLPAILYTGILIAQQAGQNNLPFKMEDITSPKFPVAVNQAGSVCVIPLGVIEKHGPALPLGTDLYEAREIAFHAALKEYAVIFPPYFTGQINEARHQPGTIAYSSELMWKMLEETCKELSRNGLKKIILLNGHGGNTSFLQYFCQEQLAKQQEYIVLRQKLWIHQREYNHECDEHQKQCDVISGCAVQTARSIFHGSSPR
jgi:creatinine amidohydrolase